MSAAAIVLAAGQGTRMKSELPKVLHRVAGRPLVVWSVEIARAAGAEEVVVVLGHKLDDVRKALDGRYGTDALKIVRQERLLGTGDAVRTALGALEGLKDTARVLILSGDVPLVRPETVAALLAARGIMSIVTARPDAPHACGRVVRDEAGRVMKVVEERDASPEVRAIAEINAGIYAVVLGFLRKEIGSLSAKNAQGELYLTDLVERAAAAGEVATVEADPDDVAGVNDRTELARLETIARRRIVERWQLDGVTIVDPASTFIDADVTAIGRDSELGPGVHLRGRTRLGQGVRIDTGCVLSDTEVADGAVLKPYCVFAEAKVGGRAQVGPYSHCRPGTELGEDVHLGNFVETKKTILGRGAKANHLAYLGDAEIGAKVNVGAGTITCNYDGQTKSKTIIEEGAFIGSDTQLVAPVRVGKDAYVGAGTTVTEDVPAGALALTRSPQVNVEGYVERKKNRPK